MDGDRHPDVAVKGELNVVLALLGLIFLTINLSSGVWFHFDKVKRVAAYVDQAFQGLCRFVGLRRGVGKRNWLAAEEVQIRVVPKQERLRLWRIKLFASHYEVGAKVVARFGRVPENLC